MREPDRSSPVAKAWRFQGQSAKPDHSACLAQWLLNGPFHPMWSWWAISVIHLRPIEGVRPAVLQYPEAEHELMIVSINPSCYPPDPDGVESLALLQPLDLQYQFHGVGDDNAREICGLVIDAILDGRGSPDSDFRGFWKNSLDTTVEHYRDGTHGGDLADVRRG